MSRKSTIILTALALAITLAAFAPSCRRGVDATPADPMKVPQPPNPTAAANKPFVPAPEGLPNPTGNLLVNPGFETDREGWFYMETSKHWEDFKISDKIAHLGKKSAFLDIMGTENSPDVRIYGVVQTLKPSRFPDKISGWYRVEKWKRGSVKQYAQFVVIVWGGHEEFKNYQCRYILAGSAVAPYDMKNVRYIMSPTSGNEPETKKWVYFEAPIRADFIKYWGRPPTGYEKINVFFESRFDAKPKPGETVEAQVYWDDLYVGD